MVGGERELITKGSLDVFPVEAAGAAGRITGARSQAVYRGAAVQQRPPKGPPRKATSAHRLPRLAIRQAARVGEQAGSRGGQKRLGREVRRDEKLRAGSKRTERRGRSGRCVWSCGREKLGHSGFQGSRSRGAAERTSRFCQLSLAGTSGIGGARPALGQPPFRGGAACGRRW